MVPHCKNLRYRLLCKKENVVELHTPIDRPRLYQIRTQDNGKPTGQVFEPIRAREVFWVWKVKLWW